MLQSNFCFQCGQTNLVSCLVRIWHDTESLCRRVVETYLTAYLEQPAALGGSRWRLLLSWQRSELLWPWASCLMHDTSCSPAAGAPPAELYHPSSSALAGAESLINKKEKDSGYRPQIHLKNKLKNMNDTMSNTRDDLVKDSPRCRASW